MNFDQTVQNAHSIHQLLSLTHSGGVHRYHTHLSQMLKAQTTAEHAYNCVLILLWLCELPSRSLIIATLLHDAGERWVGDMPSPVKRKLGTEAQERLDKMEQEAFAAHTGRQIPPLTARDQALLHVADTLEGLLHSYQERMLGNRLMAKTWYNYHGYLVSLAGDPLLTAEEAAKLKLAIDFFSPEATKERLET